MAAPRKPVQSFAERWSTLTDVEELLIGLGGKVDKVEEVASVKRKHIAPQDVTIIPPGEVDSVALAPRSDGYTEPWGQLPDEPERSFEMFKWYRDQGLTRTIKATAEHFGVKAVGVSNDYASPYRWRDRARAFDDHEDRVYRLSLDRAVREMAERHASSMAEGLQALTAPFIALQKRIEIDPEEFWEDLANTDAKRLIELAVKVGRVLPAMMGAERLARGLPSEITKVEGSIEHDHIHRADRGQIEQIVAALESAGALDVGSGARQLGPPGEPADDEVYDLDPVE